MMGDMMQNMAQNTKRNAKQNAERNATWNATHKMMRNENQRARTNMASSVVPASVSRRGFVQVAALGALGVASAAAGVSSSGCAGIAQGTGNVHIETDMVGRQVAVPEHIRSVFCSNPIGSVDLYMLAPELMAGWNFKVAGDNTKYIKQEYRNLPSLGVWMGAGSTPNDEEIVSVNPDLILCYWTADDVGIEMANSVQNETGICTLGIDYDLRSAPEMFRYVAGLLGVEARGEELAQFCELKLAQIARVMARVPERERASIYLAQGEGGLSTDPVGSMHVTDALELLDIANVAEMPGTVGKGMGMPTVNLEQIINWKPDAVLVSEYSMSDAESSNLYDEIRNDSNWKMVPCVQEGRVYRIPQSPFSWFGRPPSAIRVLGCLWVAKIMYPDYAGDIDIVQETRDAYQLCYDYTLSESELVALLSTAGIEV